MEFLGITRERVYSPGKVDADREILHDVAVQLAAHGDVRVANADDELVIPMTGATIFAMAQGPEVLTAMREWQERGFRIINTPDAIEGCHRHRMLARFIASGVRHPQSFLLETNSSSLPDWVNDGAWLKRGDVHATECDDVVRVDSIAEAQAVMRRFAARGIARVLLQRHIEGPVVKFYAVRGRYFEFFPETPLELDAPSIERMRTLGEEGAAALGLEVFGGDFVCDAAGEFWLIDLNDWPSYGRCRSRAAREIAGYILDQLRR